MILRTAALAAAFASPAHTDCHSRECNERVARKACSQERVLPCIKRAAIHHRVSYTLQRAIAWCESRLNPYRKNAHSTAAGLMQFIDSTWASTPYALRWVYSAKWNALGGGWLLRRAGTHPWVSSRGCWG